MTTSEGAARQQRRSGQAEFVRRAVRSLRYLLAVGGTAVLALFGLYALLAVFALSLVGPGLALVPLALARLRRVADAHRLRAGRWLGCEVPSSYRRVEGGVLARAQTMLADRATWTDLLWLLAHAVFGTVGAALVLGLCTGAASWLTVPLWWQLAPEPPQFMVWEIDSWGAALAACLAGAAYGALAGWLLPWWAQLHALLTRALLGPRKRRTSLAERVVELTITRAEALEAHAAELRRIERDLHDGAQAGLVSVALRLAVMKQVLHSHPEKLPELIDQARDLTDQAVKSLRGAVRSIYPPVLVDHGLAEAARSLVAACPVPTSLDVEQDAGGSRAPVAVEAAAYFVMSEALTNVAKHSGAAAAQVRLRIAGNGIRICVRDDGRGGAGAGPGPEPGSGISGIRRRVAAFDGVTDLQSPPGGPTELRVELPCGS
ncbi:sensor histidine kinase [Kitasatospora sp. CB01950]|uniref:sensor histidine kinase n=1 Tax=Kitasatospora sp. CB01950 TaxID=1703930 RepID=UPI00093FA068|nr:sensor histidine kinase [Kitasatospora sp. CB01950]OKJ13716.1 histidine kinase [Kitasatospora sp. CB01950]